MLSFGHPWFLIGLAGLAIPLILHLLNRQRTTPFPFPSIRFIRPTRVPREGRRQLRDFLLLLIRLLVLAVAVCAVTRPVWQRSRVPAVAAASQFREIILVVDASASMDGWGGYAAVQTVARRLIAEHPAARVGLVTSPPAARIAMPPGSERAELNHVLASLKPSPFRGDPASAIREALRLLSDPGQRLLAVISDFQVTDWQNVQLPALPPGVRIDFIPVNPRRSDNAGILAAKSTILADGATRVTAVVHNFGSASVRRAVELRSGNQTHQRTLILPPRQSREVSFVLPKPTSAQAELRMERDLYAGDDTYVTWIGPRPVISVLACVPMNTEPEKQQEFFFVRKALETQTDGDGDVFSVRSVEPEFFSTLDLAGFPVVFLLGAGGRFQDVEWRLCRQYVEQGGWLVCTPGTRTLEQFRAIRENSLGGDEFAGVQQSDTAVQGVPFSVSWVNPEGPLAAYAADSFDSELFLFPIRKYARLRPAADTRVLLRAVTGDPLLVERPVGKGRFLQFAYGFDLSWSEMAMTTAFLPILREVATTAVPADFGTLRVECAGAVPDSLARVFRSDTRGGHRESLPDLGQPGVYKVRQTPVEVNISRQESVPEQIDIAALHRRFTGDAGGTAAPHAVAGIQETGWPLWPGLTAAAALLYLLEIVVASFLDQREMRRPQSVQDLPPTTARGGAAP